MKRWSETLNVSQATTFAGFGFTMAAKALRERWSPVKDRGPEGCRIQAAAEGRHGGVVI